MRARIENVAQANIEGGQNEFDAFLLIWYFGLPEFVQPQQIAGPGF